MNRECPYIPFKKPQEEGPKMLSLSEKIKAKKEHENKKRITLEREIQKKTIESIFAKWMEREFVQFLDKDETNFAVNNVVPIELRDIIQNWGKLSTNVIHGFSEDELKMIYNKDFRDSLYFDKSERPDLV